jgi:type III secretion protein U
MSGGRSEEPTARRIRDARRRGQIAASRELTAAAALAGGLTALALHGTTLAGTAAAGLRASLARAVQSPPVPAAALRAAAGELLRLALPPCAGALLAALAAGALQAGFLFSTEAFRPRLERIDPRRGLARLLTPSQLAGVGLGVAKGVALLWVAAAWLRGAATPLAGLARLEVPALWRAIPLLGSLGARLALTLALFGLADLALARRRYRRGLRMTRNELRREHRDDEGDPTHRAERRRAHRALLEAGPVARATVVIVNPTHLAVALRHDRRADGAPRVIAKGVGPGAARIRSAARRAGVPVVRDIALARALLRLSEVGEEIPEELYEAAAVVLAHLYGIEEAANP